MQYWAEFMHDARVPPIQNVHGVEQANVVRLRHINNSHVSDVIAV